MEYSKFIFFSLTILLNCEIFHGAPATQGGKLNMYVFTAAEIIWLYLYQGRTVHSSVGNILQ